VVPTTSYIVAASARSGSTLLCRALSDTGVAGNPEEYFLCGPADAFPEGWEFWERGIFARPHGAMDRGGYLDLVHRLGTTPNGVFGVKLMWNYVPWVLEEARAIPRFAGIDRAAVFRLLLPGLRHVVIISRRDRVRQAVSWARAAHDGVWVISDDEPAAPTGIPQYQFDFLKNLEGLLEEAAVGWPGLCEELGVEPLYVTYEDLVDAARYPAIIAGILDYLGVTAAADRAPTPRTIRQSDELNEDWVTRYLHDRDTPASP
jgi:trehalose 2-sulfotransferase